MRSGSKWFHYGLLLAMIFCAVYAPDIFAQEPIQTREASEGAIDDLKMQLKRMEDAFLKQQEMMKQMETLVLNQQEQIKELKNRIETISEKPATVATEEIKEEVKQEVGNYLASDEAREKLGLGLSGKYESVNGYYTPDKERTSIGFQTRDGKYSLNMGFRTQMRFTYRDRDADFHESDIADIDLRRARVCFGGNVYSKDLNYYVELSGDSYDVSMWDYYVYWTPLAALNIKTGYFKVPASRQWQAAAFKLLFQDRSIATDAFKQDRDYGLDIYGLPFEGHVEYHASVFRGAGQNPLKTYGKDENIDNNLMYVLSARYNPFGIYDYYDETDLKYTETFKATVGASVVYNAKEKNTKLSDTDVAVGNFDLGMRYKGFTWDSGYYIRSKNPENDIGDTITSDGFYTQAGYFIIPKKLEVGTRYSMLDPDSDIRDDIQKEYSAGINYYFRGHRSKIQTDVARYITDTKDGNNNESRFRLQYQLIF